MKNYSSANIKGLVLLAVFLAVLPPLGMLLASGVQRYHEAQEDVQRRALSSVRSMSERQRNITENTLTILSSLHRVIALRSFAPDASNDLFADIVSGYPLFDNIYIFSPDGRVQRRQALPPRPGHGRLGASSRGDLLPRSGRCSLPLLPLFGFARHAVLGAHEGYHGRCLRIPQRGTAASLL